MKKQYKLEDFKDFLLSPDIDVVILGLKMLKASIPFKSMDLLELYEFEQEFLEVKYQFIRRNFNDDFYNSKGQIHSKIHNCRQKK